MVIKVKKIREQKLWYLVIFGLFFLLFSLSPISGDDWGNYLVGEKGLYHCFGQAWGMYFSWEGRLISRILINILTYHKWLWNIVNSLLLTGFIYTIGEYTKSKNKKMNIILCLLMLFGMNIYTFSQIMVWLAGNITYLFPLIFIILYLFLQKLLSTKWKNILMLGMNIIIPMFVEHMAVLLVLINLVILGNDYLKTKKWNKQYFLFFLISVISTLFMFLSPGTSLRSSMENTEFSKMSLVHKVLYNIPNYIYYTYIVNSLLLLAISGFMNRKIYQQDGLKIQKVFFHLYTTILPVATILIYNLSNFIQLPAYLLELVNPSNVFIQIYWISYTIYYLYILCDNRKTPSTKKAIFLTILAFCSNGIMLASPTWGYRTSVATYILLMIPLIKEYSEIENHYFQKALKVITGLAIICFLIFYTNIYFAQKEREERIEMSLNNKDSIIEIEAFPSYANCNINPGNEYHLEKFKEYYNIPEDVEVVIKPTTWRFIIIK